MPQNVSCSSRGSIHLPIGYCRKYHKGSTCGGCSCKNECKDPSSPAKPSLAKPTPVKINSLAPLLSGYSTSTAENLINGFCFGFPFHFKALLLQPLPLICYHLNSILTWLILIQHRRCWHSEYLAPLLTLHFKLCGYHLPG